MHPRGSGVNASLSISDIVSLDRKIRVRGMSSDQLSLLDVTSSRGNSRRGSKVSIDISLKGIVEREKSCSSIILPIRQDSIGWTGISTIFSRESIRVGVSDCDVDPGVIGPYLRPRELVEVVKMKVKVLVVDDSSLTRKLLSKILVGKGYQVFCAVDGQSCLDMIETAAAQGSSVSYSNAYDVIIMDSNMPRMSGNETCKILRCKGFKGMICGVTGNTSQKDVESFIASGASLVLPKPLDINAFEKELRAFLRTEIQDFHL
jgi:CheY-like chemotaxis protein